MTSNDEMTPKKAEIEALLGRWEASADQRDARATAAQAEAAARWEGGADIFRICAQELREVLATPAPAAAEVQAQKALRNVLLMANRCQYRQEHGKAVDADVWATLRRFCAEGGVENSPLRDHQQAPAAGAEALLGEAIDLLHDTQTTLIQYGGRGGHTHQRVRAWLAALPAQPQPAPEGEG
ncbi:hypothetical protein K7W42_18060 [Deinococcus sp. HMF7604]|uniref:hypothetical protein n=1 Tax=Deinococcus betulae TaxID=2873312 RepID=UPI001CCFDDBA|nr:hypothetical protein [Deinococcus betulae]MBZ9752749.1 hypothetical protein [Deinococcus betulae]